MIYNLHGAVGYRVDFAGLSMVFPGDTHPCWPLVHAARGTDLLIHEFGGPTQSSRTTTRLQGVS
ncbi:MAG: hypothetical protein MUE31_11905, partial [Candidatus Nanopelagicales bacterium]|nr:hypothetical protein [Candidatus Nanopelagicales bacterium]